MNNRMKTVIMIFMSMLLLSITGCYYDQSNAKELSKSKVIIKPKVEEEIEYIKKLRKKVESWEENNKPKILRDGYNTKVTEKNRYEKPVKGGIIKVHVQSEPKLLNHILDNSGSTNSIIGYIYNSLLSRDSETYEWEPSLAKSYDVQDIVWLKGKKEDSVFKNEKGDNNYIICKVDESKIKWDSNKEKIEEMRVLVNKKEKIIKGEELRYKKDPKDGYTRAYDCEVIFNFNLREDVKWHDGKPFTADDVIFTIGIIKNVHVFRAAPLRSYYEPLKAWKKVSKYKVEFYFDKQYFKALEFANIAVLPKHAYVQEGETYTEKELAQRFSDPELNKTPIGTGPYYFPSKKIPNRSQEEGWKKKTHVVLIRNDDYFKPKERGYLKKIYFKFIPSSETAFIELKNGNIDFIPRVMNDEQFFEGSNSPQFKAQYVKALYYMGYFSYIGLNNKKLYFENKKIRQAITMLVDKEKILQNIYYGMGKIVSGSQFYFGPAYNHDIKPRLYNRKKAIELLNESGWIDSDGDGIRDKNGVQFDVEILYPTGSSYAEKIFPFLYEEFLSVGLKIRSKKLEWSVFIEHLMDRKYDMCILAWGTPIESDPYQIWHSSQWGNKGSNHVGYDNKEVDHLIEKARITINDQERYKLYNRFHEILDEDQPYVFLFVPEQKAFYHNRYRNVKLYRVSTFNLIEWYIPLELQTKEEREVEKN